MKNETSTPNIFRPFRAAGRVGRVPGVKTPGRRRYALARPRHRSYDAKNLAATKALRSRAESFCPSGHKSDALRRPQPRGCGVQFGLGAALQHSNTPVTPRGRIRGRDEDDYEQP